MDLFSSACRFDIIVQIRDRFSRILFLNGSIVLRSFLKMCVRVLIHFDSDNIQKAPFW